MKTEHITTIMNLIENAELAETARAWEGVLTCFLFIFLIVTTIVSVSTLKINAIVSAVISFCLLVVMAIIMSYTPTKETLYKEAYVYLVNQGETMNINYYEKIEQIIISELTNKESNK